MEAPVTGGNFWELSELTDALQRTTEQIKKKEAK